jgi:hypothetical protein
VYITTGAAKYCGREIELNLPVTPEQARLILNSAVSQCKRKAQRIESDSKMLIYSVPVLFRQLSAMEERFGIFWRLIMSDDKGVFPDDKRCNPLFSNQIPQPLSMN